MGSRALVTGASVGIGEAIARRFSIAGAEVVLVSRTEERLRRVASEMEHTGGSAMVVPFDLLDPSGLQRLPEVVGPIDILVNNAVIPRHLIPFLEEDDQHWTEVLQTALWAPYVLMREFAKGMAERGSGGVIINVSSIAGQRALPLMAHYSVSKAGLDMLTRVAAIELAEHGIRCVGIAPGYVEVAHSKDLVASSVSKTTEALTPLGRPGLVAEVADTALFLASNAASFITGQVITVDGGATAGHVAALASLRQARSSPPRPEGAGVTKQTRGSE